MGFRVGPRKEPGAKEEYPNSASQAVRWWSSDAEGGSQVKEGQSFSTGPEEVPAYKTSWPGWTQHAMRRGHDRRCQNKVEG